MLDHVARDRIAVLEERALEQDRKIAALQTNLSRRNEPDKRLIRAETEIARLSSALDAMRTSFESGHKKLNAWVKKLKGSNSQLTSDFSALSSAFDSLRSTVSAPKSPPSASTIPVATSSPNGFDSAIIRDFPLLFAEFQRKRFTLLWRGTRDGFGEKEFHKRCNGHANTLTMILDTGGSIFGGFTPVKWESGGEGNNYRADPSGTSFLFTLKNPHNFPPKKFALKSTEKDKAIECRPSYGPCFGYDIWVTNNSNANSGSDSFTFGAYYVNDTGLNERTFFTGTDHFTVKEIEVFEITN
jgi:uncharacterized coiled-coil protein SlyX